jgi:phosphoserine phosphatase RsbU/P
VGRGQTDLDELLRELAARGVHGVAAAWDSLPADAEVVLALSPPPPDFPLEKLSPGTLLAAGLAREEGSGLRDAGALVLPPDSPPAVIAELCGWLASRAGPDRAGEIERHLRASPTVIMTLDGQGVVTGVHPRGARFLGQDAALYAGRQAAELFGGPGGSSPASSPEAGALRMIADADGKEIPLLVSVSPGPDGRPAALVVTAVREAEGYIRRNALMAGIHQNMTLQRQSELEAANELYQKQAMELTRVLGELENRNQKIVEELELAGELQQSLLPKEFPRDMALEFSHKYLPASYVSGDFFDVIPLGPGKAGIIVADVSGHGVAPAFLTTMFKGIFKANAADCGSPAVVMTRVNKEMCQTLRSEHYLTAFYAVIDTERMQVTYSNAGHPKQLLLRAAGPAEELTTAGFFIGMFEGTEYGEASCAISPGDRLLLYTDGVIEVADAGGTQFGREGILRVAQANAGEGAEALSAALFQELLGFLGDATFPDDVTIIVAQAIDSL